MYLHQKFDENNIDTSSLTFSYFSYFLQKPNKALKVGILW